MECEIKMQVCGTPLICGEADSEWNNRPPLKRLPMLKLPSGSIKTEGWLKKQMELMLDGITGRLPEYGEYFARDKNGWLYSDTDAGWEEVPYWFRGFYSLAVATGDHRCLQICGEYIDAMIGSQDEDGYFGPKYLKRMSGKNGKVLCDIFPHMIVLSAFTEHYERTGDKRVLQFMRGFFDFCAALPEEQFVPLSTEGNLGWGGGDFGSLRPFIQSIRAGEMLPHLFWHYNITGEEKSLRLARRFFRRIRPPWDEWLDPHAVNFAQRYAYSGIYYQLSHLEYHLKQVEYWYAQHMQTWGQMPRGIFAADERIRQGCVDPRQAFETCGMVEFARNFYMLGRITGDPIYADRCEDIMLNHFTAAYTPDQKGVHYLTAANMPQLDASFHHNFRNGDARSNRSFIAYTPYNRCCGHNAGMGWPWYAANLWQATADGGLASWLYAPCAVTAKVGGKTSVTLDVHTDYPFKGKVEITLKSTDDVKFPLYLRIPGWCKDFSVCLNGSILKTICAGGKFALLDRIWKSGDRILMQMEMETSCTQWPRNGSVSIDRGPLSYSVKIEEEWIRHLEIGCYKGSEQWPNYEVLPKTPWNYGLALDPAQIKQSVKVSVKDQLAEQPWTVAGAPVELRLKARRIPNWGLQDETAAELQNSPICTDGEPEEEIAMIPLGCARLRMSCLPLVEDGDESTPWAKAPERIAFEKRPKSMFDVLQEKVDDKVQKDV